jgi:uncharacterized protein involved in outer membrane biogenesis
LKYRPSRRLLISGALVAALSAAGIALLPEVSRRLAINRLESVFTVPVKIQDVDLNLFTGRAAIENLAVGGADNPRPILNIPAASIDFSPLGLLTGQIDLNSIVLQSPTLFLERLGPATYNVLKAVDFTKESPKAGGRSGGVSFAMERLEIRGGEVVFIDHTQEPDYKVTFSSLDLTAGPIASLPGAEVTPTNFTAAVQIAGGTVKVAGSSTLFGTRRQTQMTAGVANVQLANFSAYLPYGTRLNLDKSSLNAEAKYVLAYGEGKASGHYIDATARIGSIALLPAAGDQPIAQVAGLTARDVHLDLLKNQGQIGAIVLREPYLLLMRDSSGLNLQQFMPSGGTAAATGAQTEGASGAMRLLVEQLMVESGRVEFIDHTVTPAVETTLQSLTLTASDVLLLPQFASGQIKAEGQLGNGSLNLSGNIDNEPLRGEFALTGKQLPYEPLRGYIDQIFTSANSSGDYVNGELKIAFEPEKEGDIVTSLAGTVEGHNMALRFPAVDEPFLTTARLGVDLRNIRIDENVLFDIAQISFTGANLRVVRGKDGRLNLTQLWSGEEEERSGAAQEQKKDGETTLAIHAITVNESVIAIRDHSVSPNYTTRIARLNGKVVDLLPSAKRAELKFAGTLGDSATVTATGWFTPFSEKPYVRIEAAIRSYALPPLNPYATEYISHRIRQGQITTEIDYTLKGDELQASAEIVLRDLRVGERTGDQFAQQIGIPLELAVALLQDISGAIRLQVAITSETGPRLNIGNLIWTAVRNAIVKALTAPFRLVGNILSFGGRIGGIRIEPVAFEPGTRELRPESQRQIEELADLLKEKPKLELKLSGNVSQSEMDALKKKEFWERIQNAKGRGYEEALIQVYRDLGGITQPATPLTPVAEQSLEKFVMERLEVADEEIRRLANDRAEIVERELQERGIDPQRLSRSGNESLVAGETPLVQIEIVS